LIHSNLFIKQTIHILLWHSYFNLFSRPLSSQTYYLPPSREEFEESQIINLQNAKTFLDFFFVRTIDSLNKISEVNMNTIDGIRHPHFF
jgi:hypothetical protein